MSREYSEKDRAIIKSKFLDKYAKTRDVDSACKTAKIQRATIYSWKKQDEEFANDWNMYAKGEIDENIAKRRRQKYERSRKVLRDEEMVHADHIAKQKSFIKALSTTLNVSRACEMADVSNRTVYKWRQQDTEFSRQWEEALECSRDTARQSIYQRGILGWEEPVVSSGQLVYEWEDVLDDKGNTLFDSKGKPMKKRGKMLMVRKYSDAMATLFAKGNLPEYREKYELNIQATLETNMNQAKEELLAELAGSLMQDRIENDKKNDVVVEPIIEE